jgi:hypothetical protein
MAISCMLSIGNVYKVIVGKFQVKRSVGRSGHRYEDKIKIDLREPMGCMKMRTTSVVAALCSGRW